MLPLLFVNEVLREDVSSHAVGVAIRYLDALVRCHLVQPSYADLVALGDMTKGRCLACLQDTGGRLVILVQLELYLLI
jgi:hypothetical protein